MASVDRPDFELSAPIARSSAGDTLRATRQAQGLTVEAVAKQLKLSVRQITAIEADDMASLPSATFVRGFIRNYARLLKLDPDALLGREESRRAAASPLEGIPVAIGELPSDAQYVRPATFLKWAIPVCLALLLIAGAWYESRKVRPSATAGVSPDAAAQVSGQASTNAPRPTAAGLAPDVNVPSTQPAESSAPSQNPTGSQPAIPGTSNTVPAGATQPASDANVANVTAPASAVPNAPRALGTGADAAVALVGSAASTAVAPQKSNDAPAKPLPGAAHVLLDLTFNDKSWTEIRDAKGTVISSKTHAPGSKLSVSGQPPFRFIIGNAKKVELKRDGVAVDVVVRAGSGDVAKFSID